MKEAAKQFAHSRNNVKLTERQTANFWAKINKSAGKNGCWLWTGFIHARGYGRFGVYPVGPIAAHRVMWMVNNGRIPNGMEICHRCDNPACVNPKHLFIGTHMDNMIDRDSKGRQVVLRGTRHGMAKIGEGDVKTIRNLYAGGMNGAEIGRLYDLNRHHILDIVRRKLWKTVA